MAIRSDVVTDRAAPELGAWQIGYLSKNIPQRQIDSRDGGGPHHSVTMPEMLAIHHLPEMLDPPGIFANEQAGNILDRSDHAFSMPFQRRLAPTVEAGLIGEDFDEDPIPHPCMTDVSFDSGYFHGRRSRACNGQLNRYNMKG